MQCLSSSCGYCKISFPNQKQSSRESLKLKKLNELKENSESDHEDYEKDIENLKIHNSTSRLIITALREIIDGIVWRYFDYNRALLYIVADKQPVDLINADKGLMSSLYELADVFNKKGDRAILNDISNFLRIGDVTNIKSDGTIEFIEVKSSKTRGARFTRQKERMREIVELFNTRVGELDGQKFILSESNVRQTNYLKQLKDSIHRARNIGYDSILIGSHLIVETLDFRTIIYKDKNKDKFEKYFESKHKSIKDRWSNNGDFIVKHLSIDKLRYAKNYAPYTIFPFEDDIIADILMGKLIIVYYLNNNEVIRVLEKGGWDVVYSFTDLTEEKMNEVDPINMDFYRIQKENCIVSIPAPWFGRLCATSQII